MTIIEQIKAQIEGWLREYAENSQFELGERYGYKRLLSLLSTIESEKPVPNDLDKAAKEYAKTTFKKPYSDNPDEEVTIVEPDKYAGFIAGAKRQKEQDDKLVDIIYQQGIEKGKDEMKEQILKDAIDADVKLTLHDKTGDISLHTGYLPKELGIKYDDKVRIIIVKED